ncbi:MAG: beta-propeller domain-containing protein [bacterium]
MKKDNLLVMGLLISVVALLLAGVYFISSDITHTRTNTNKTNTNAVVSSTFDLKPFSSAEEFTLYAQAGEDIYQSSQSLGMNTRSLAIESPTFESDEEVSTSGSAADRVSATNVQVLGIDEPDILKTDGQTIFISTETTNYYRGITEPLIMEDTGEDFISPLLTSDTKLLNAYPPDELTKTATINEAGELLMSGNTLVVFNYEHVRGYDVTDPTDPEVAWTISFSDNGSMVDARLKQGTIYLVTQTYIDTNAPCPIMPLVIDGQELSMPCTGIYHPTENLPIDVTYTVLAIDLKTGQVTDSTSVVGTSASTVLYMSNSGLYLTHTFYNDYIEFFNNFIAESASDLFSAEFQAKIKRLLEYNLSAAAKMTEFEILSEKYLGSLDDDEQLRVENELQNRLTTYYADNLRKLERTGIVKIDLDDLSVSASGEVPGQPLNQFALDEYNGNLRIATTTGGRSSSFGGSESANDVYVLSSNLDIIGSVLNLGLEGESIYGVRFIEDEAYVVTFRQTDPFYVLDLSNPTQPRQRGELKIPGYSSYLHPLADNLILGVGKESSQVKLSLFDVTDPDNPIEKSKYTLDEYWTEVLDTHQAFLQDAKYKVFFMPGSRGGYVFSYDNDTLELTKTVAGFAAKRALYLNDYLYILGNDELTVLDEKTWEIVKDFTFGSVVESFDTEETDQATEITTDSSD